MTDFTTSSKELQPDGFPTRNRRYAAVIGMILLVITVAVYYPVVGFDFVDLDDDGYVFRNERILSGLTMENIKWALQTTTMANWHPVTWMSYMLDVELFGATPGVFHRTNLCFHLANCLLLFLLLDRTTNRLWPSMVVAALFALHPLHVESVAWVSERKDVISTFFWLLCSLMYLRYTRHLNKRGYLAVVVLFILGLAAKPMVVTLPIVLLLMDYWPLDRMCRFQPPVASARRLSFLFLVFEKIPLLLIALAGGLVTLFAQKGFAAVQTLEALPLGTRLANAAISIVGYLFKMAWPVSLSVLYPYPERISPWGLSLAIGLIMVISIGVYHFRQNKPYLVFGWLWYLVTLLPVIGIIQVGNQAMADRYTYIPLIGIFTMLAWGANDWLSKKRFGRAGTALVVGAVLIALAVMTRYQVTYWQNSLTLFRHTLAVTGDNFLAHNGLGMGYERQGNLVAAEMHYREALRLSPGFTAARYNLGNVYLKRGMPEAAVSEFKAGLAREPGDPELLNNLAKALIEIGRIEDGLATFRQALENSSADPGLSVNYATALIMNGQLDEAAAVLVETVKLQPDYARAHLYLGIVRERQGKPEIAGRYYETAIQLAPDNQAARRGRQRIKAGKQVEVKPLIQ